MLIYGMRFTYKEIENFGRHRDNFKKFKKIDENTPLLKDISEDFIEEIINKTWDTLPGFYQRLPKGFPIPYYTGKEQKACYMCDFYIGIENKFLKTKNINDVKQQIFKLCNKYNLPYKSLNLYTI